MASRRIQTQPQNSKRVSTRLLMAEEQAIALEEDERQRIMRQQFQEAELQRQQTLQRQAQLQQHAQLQHQRLLQQQQYQAAPPYRQPFPSQHQTQLVNMAELVEALTTRLYNPVMELAEQVKKQGEIIQAQQKTINELQEKADAYSREGRRQYEDIRIDLHDLGQKTKALKLALPEAFSRMVGETKVEMKEVFRTALEKLEQVEEEVVGLREEMQDPEANLDPIVRRDVAVSPRTPRRNVRYAEAGVVPRTPTPSETDSRPRTPRLVPANLSDESGFHTDGPSTEVCDRRTESSSYSSRLRGSATPADNGPPEIEPQYWPDPVNDDVPDESFASGTNRFPSLDMPETEVVRPLTHSNRPPGTEQSKRPAIIEVDQISDSPEVPTSDQGEEPPRLDMDLYMDGPRSRACSPVSSAGPIEELLTFQEVEDVIDEGDTTAVAPIEVYDSDESLSGSASTFPDADDILMKVLSQPRKKKKDGNEKDISRNNGTDKSTITQKTRTNITDKTKGTEATVREADVKERPISSTPRKTGPPSTRSTVRRDTKQVTTRTSATHATESSVATKQKNGNDTTKKGDNTIKTTTESASTLATTRRPHPRRLSQPEEDFDKAVIIVGPPKAAASNVMESPRRAQSFSSLSTLSSLPDEGSAPVQHLNTNPNITLVSAPIKRSRYDVEPTRQSPRKRRRIDESGNSVGSAMKKSKASTSTSLRGTTSGEKGKGMTTKRVKREMIDRTSPLKETKRRARKSKDKSGENKSKMKGEVEDEDEGGSMRQFIQCENCSLWYHWGCVGIDESDRRVQEKEAVYVCEPCALGQSPPRTHISDLTAPHTCAWPTCDAPTGTSNPNEYFIERLIGRYDRKISGPERYSWLVKWEGYPVEVSGWTPGNELPKPGKLIEEFELAAKAEGTLNATKRLILLKEAIAGGWNKRKE